jgi:hypothetical protein
MIYSYIMSNLNIFNCVGRNVVYSFGDGDIYSEGVVETITNGAVKIGAHWYNIESIQIKAVLDGNIGESSNNGETLIKG